MDQQDPAGLESQDVRMAPLRILIVDDSADDAELVQRGLRRNGLEFAAEVVDSEPGFTAALGRLQPDIVVCDFHMPRFTCRRAMEILAQLPRPVPLLVVSRHISEEESAEVRIQGARGVVHKSEMDRLAAEVRSALGDDAP